MTQAVQGLESVKTPQVLPPDVSISHDFLGQDTQVFQAHEKGSSSRVAFSSIYFKTELDN
jgi:hypothetical protein